MTMPDDSNFELKLIAIEARLDGRPIGVMYRMVGQGRMVAQGRRMWC